MLKDLTSLELWASQYFKTKAINLLPLPHDASLRRYYRITQNNKNFIVADSSYDLNVYKKFIDVNLVFKKFSLRVPEIFACNNKEGFLILTDFGDQTYFAATNKNNFASNYQNAIKQIILLQKEYLSESANQLILSHLDATFLAWELERFAKYFLQMQLNIQFSDAEKIVLQNCFKILVSSASLQPQIIIHRDYHSKNLMVLNNNEVGILDFQDAMLGPLTYDLASLLRDCYVHVARDDALQLVKYYYENRKNNFAKSDKLTLSKLIKYFDFMSIQRDLKAIYTFSYKFLEHHDQRYQPYIKTAFNYIIETSALYSEFFAFKELIQQKVLPVFLRGNFL